MECGCGAMRWCRAVVLLVVVALAVLPVSFVSAAAGSRSAAASSPPYQTAIDPDFILTAEQRKLLFEETASSPPAPQAAAPPSSRPAVAAVALAATGESSIAASEPASNASSSSVHLPSLSPSSLPSSPAVTACAVCPSCPDDMGGVRRVALSLFPAAAMRQAGDYSLSFHFDAAQLSALTRLLRVGRDEDVEDLILLTEDVLRTATLQSYAEAAAAPAVRMQALAQSVLTSLGLPSSWTQAALVWVQVLAMVACVAVGYGLSAWSSAGRRPAAPDQAPSPMLSRSVRRGSVVSSFASSLWVGVLLLVLVLFVAGYVHHYHVLFIEQRARNRVLQSNPPAGCFDTTPSLSSLLTSISSYLTRASQDDACWRWEASLHASSYPNPLVALSSFLSLTLLSPLHHAGDALGAFTRAYLSHHGVLMQLTMMTFLLLFLLGCVALCMMLGKLCTIRMLTGGAEDRDGRRRLEGVRRRRRRSRDVQIEEMELELVESDEEEDGQRRRIVVQRRRKEDVVRPLRLVNAADSDELQREQEEKRAPRQEEEEEEEMRALRRSRHLGEQQQPQRLHSSSAMQSRSPQRRVEQGGARDVEVKPEPVVKPEPPTSPPPSLPHPAAAASPPVSFPTADRMQPGETEA